MSQQVSLKARPAVVSKNVLLYPVAAAEQVLAVITSREGNVCLT